ncbi:Retrovirus-related Pol polyprotein from transposon TNT 1-94 [Sesamum alatum]|uniref:Retrovirus-related Pol polyprotein from transposon TNT 1-94 n=1 Tax=Sesamum alatum TaxID=300844 RepID=A0AAE1Y3N9_9LAMI|nr:Retrovirus-related Pol polyprotein from transposon TNT 1-94 [Sesamum alatum]
MVMDLPQLIKLSRVCKECLYGKQQRDPFPKKSAWRAELPLQLIHSNVCGPIQPISNSNKRYFISIIDDCTRKHGSVFNMRNQKRLSSSKNQHETSLQIKGLRTDRGG